MSLSRSTTSASSAGGILLAAILEMDRKERRRLGLPGRWPIYEIRGWALGNPEHAETVLGFAILAAGITVGMLWHVLSPSLPWL